MAFVAAGADVIELGVPFQRSIADGPVIQKAGDKALSFGIGLVIQFWPWCANFAKPISKPRGTDGLCQPHRAV
jgi:hypothetical protein